MPFGRCAHASTKINKNIFVYGGINPEIETPECVKSLKSLYKIDS